MSEFLNVSYVPKEERFRWYGNLISEYLRPLEKSESEYVTARDGFDTCKEWGDFDLEPNHESQACRLLQPQVTSDRCLEWLENHCLPLYRALKDHRSETSFLCAETEEKGFDSDGFSRFLGQEVNRGSSTICSVDQQRPEFMYVPAEERLNKYEARRRMYDELIWQSFKQMFDELLWQSLNDCHDLPDDLLVESDILSPSFPPRNTSWNTDTTKEEFASEQIPSFIGEKLSDHDDFYDIYEDNSDDSYDISDDINDVFYDIYYNICDEKPSDNVIGLVRKTEELKEDDITDEKPGGNMVGLVQKTEELKQYEESKWVGNSQIDAEEVADEYFDMLEKRQRKGKLKLD